MTRASGRREALDPGREVARARRIALVGQERGEPFGVVDGGGTERDAGRRRSCRGWYPPGGPRSARVDDQRGAARQRGRRRRGPIGRTARRDGARPDAPLARSLQPAHRGRPPGGRTARTAPRRRGRATPASRPSVVGSSSTISLAGQAVRDAEPRPGAEDRVGDVVVPGPPPRRPATPRARPRPGRARPSPSPRRRATKRRQLGRRRLRAARRARPRTPGGRRAAGRRTATRAATARPRASRCPAGSRSACVLPAVRRRLRPRAAARGRRRARPGRRPAR